MIIRPLYVLILIGIALTFISCSSETQGTDQVKDSSAYAAKEPGSTRLSFAAYDLSGTLRHSKEWLGAQPLVVNIWGTWCPPCRAEIPALVQLYDEYSVKGVEMIGLAVNDTPRKVRNFADQNEMDWIMLMGDREVVQALGITGSVPTTIFYDRNGKEVTRFIGAQSHEVFREAFEAIL